MKTVVLAFLLNVVAALPVAAYSAPLEIAGLRLGTDIAAYADKTEKGKAETDITRPYLKTEALKNLPGFRSGYVTYGDCASPGRVVRVKMNYEDDSKEFFDKILAELTKRYGQPKEWRGNPFGSLCVWKWSLRDPELGCISLILQYYLGDDDSFTKGNSIRLAATDLLRQDNACYNKKHPEEKTTGPAQRNKDLGIDYFLPK
jgi:hypothetical protein